MDTATSVKLPEWIDDPAFRWLQERGAIEKETEPRDITLPRAVLSPTPHSMTLAYAIMVAYDVALEYFDELYAFVEQCAGKVTKPATPSERERDTSDAFLAHCKRGRHEFTLPYLGGDTTVMQLKDYILKCAENLTAKKHPVRVSVHLDRAERGVWQESLVAGTRKPHQVRSEGNGGGALLLLASPQLELPRGDARLARLFVSRRYDSQRLPVSRRRTDDEGEVY